MERVKGKFEDTHKTWHRFSNWLIKTYGEDLHGEWQFIEIGKKKIKFRSFNELELSRRITGYEVIERVERYVKSYCPAIRILSCDDDVHAGSTILLIPHPKMGISFMFIPQCTNLQNRFFLYENHCEKLINELTKMKEEIYVK